jgi:hypothetical protein
MTHETIKYTLTSLAEIQALCNKGQPDDLYTIRKLATRVYSSLINELANEAQKLKKISETDFGA